MRLRIQAIEHFNDELKSLIVQISEKKYQINYKTKTKKKGKKENKTITDFDALKDYYLPLS